jgi:hypothetical protein
MGLVSLLFAYLSITRTTKITKMIMAISAWKTVLAGASKTVLTSTDMLEKVKPTKRAIMTSRKVENP